jgi:hypothetical protein
VPGVEFHLGEPVTAKISMYRRKISIFTGRTVSGDTLFPGWDDILCRNKLAIKTDAQRLFENVGMVQKRAILGNRRQYTIGARKAQDF